jgi:hypothetical protein
MIEFDRKTEDEEVFTNFVPTNCQLHQSREVYPELLQEVKENDE